MIKIENLHYQDNFSLKIKEISINSYEKLALIGHSGSGKSTLLRLIIGLLPVKAGSISHNNNLGFLSQHFGLWSHLTALQHLAFARTRGKNLKVQQEDWELLEKLGLYLKAKQKPLFLSGGEQQRLALARCLAQKPEYLLLDEPFSNLDWVLQQELLQLLFQQQNLGILLVAHDISLIKKLNLRTLVLYQGELIADQFWQDLIKNPEHIWIQKLKELSY